MKGKPHMNKFKNCPFCGSHKMLGPISDDGGIWLECDKCPCFMWADTLELLVKFWNQRSKS
jgi:hypothetical protein